jgi:Uma2 family endonuclease
LHQKLKSRSCRVYSTDLRLRVSPTGLYTYPDIMVVCGQPEFADDRRDTVVNPVVIIEVLSDSTKNYDRGEKFRHYRGLKTLAEYVLVDQDSIHIEHFVRQSDGRWVMTEIDSPAESLQLSSIGCIVPLADVYDKIEFGG